MAYKMGRDPCMAPEIDARVILYKVYEIGMRKASLTLGLFSHLWDSLLHKTRSIIGITRSPWPATVQTAQLPSLLAKWYGEDQQERKADLCGNFPDSCYGVCRDPV